MPNWIQAKRKVVTRLGEFIIDPSPKRIEDRQAVANCLKTPGTSVEKIDRIINHFRNKYEGHSYAGLSKPERARLYAIRGGVCWICERPLKLKDMTVDHRRPRLLGGKNDWGNLEIAHLACNRARGDGITNNQGYLREELGGIYTETKVGELETEPSHATTTTPVQ